MPKNSSKPSLEGFIDQDADTRIRIRQNGKVGIFKVQELWTNPAAVLGQLANSGILVAESAQSLKLRISQIQDFPNQHVVDSPGWHLGQFVLGNGEVIKPKGAEPLVVEFNVERAAWEAAGSHKAWLEEAGPLLLGQNLARFTLAVALTPALLDLSQQTGNVIVDLFGPSSSGKTTICDHAASMWGRAGNSGDAVFVQKWDTSLHGLGLTMGRRNDCLLVIDELNGFGDGNATKTVQQQLKQAIFRLAEGTAKLTDVNRSPRMRRLIALSSSIIPCARLSDRCRVMKLMRSLSDSCRSRRTAAQASKPSMEFPRATGTYPRPSGR